MFKTNSQLVVSAIKKAEDGEGYIIRLFNGKNHENRNETLTFNFDIREAYYTNLKEEKGEALKIENNSITTKTLSHCQFITLYVK